MSKTRFRLAIILVFIVIVSLPVLSASPKDSPESWTFAVSGDSRNCGDVVMPAISADALKHNVAFYWHLGDLRAIYGPDQDYIQEKNPVCKPTDLPHYEKHAWNASFQNQLN